MYKFQRIVAGSFALHMSTPAAGDEHHKRFGSGVSPANQATLNLYTAGRFEILIPAIDYRREMAPGESSLDIELPQYPAELCIERCIEAGQRICISPVERRRWARTPLNLQAGSAMVAPGGHLLVVTAGEIVAEYEQLQAGQHILTQEGMVLRCERPSRAMLMVVV